MPWNFWFYIVVAILWFVFGWAVAFGWTPSEMIIRFLAGMAIIQIFGGQAMEEARKVLDKHKGK